MLESVASVRAHFGPELRVLEWAFTILFAAEYALRLFTVHRPLRYAVSVFGLIALFAGGGRYADHRPGLPGLRAWRPRARRGLLSGVRAKL